MEAIMYNSGHICVLHTMFCYVTVTTIAIINTHNQEEVGGEKPHPITWCRRPAAEAAHMLISEWLWPPYPPGHPHCSRQQHTTLSALASCVFSVLARCPQFTESPGCFRFRRLSPSHALVPPTLPLPYLLDTLCYAAPHPPAQFFTDAKLYFFNIILKTHPPSAFHGIMPASEEGNLMETGINIYNFYGVLNVQTAFTFTSYLI